MIERDSSDRIYDLINGGNDVTLDNLHQFIDTVFLDADHEQVSQLTQGIDGPVPRDIFNLILTSLAQKRAGHLDIFNSWDTDRKGYIDRRDLEVILKSYGLSLKKTCIDAMIGAFENERMSLDDFNGLFGRE